MPVNLHGIVAHDNRLTTVAHSKGTVMLIHGGGWLLTGPKMQTTETTSAEWWNKHGYSTYKVDYRAGIHSIGDTIAAYDWLRQHEPRKKIIVDGQSAGGSLALILAAHRPTVNGVITEGGIMDLRPPNEQVHQDALAAFGQGHLWEYSPARLAQHIKVPVLAAGSSADPIVNEPEQFGIMRRLLGHRVHTMLLPGDPTNANFIHAGVTAEGLQAFRRAALWLAAHRASNPS